MIIYKTTNLINGKIYIGQTRTKSLTKYKGGGKLLQEAFKKYGWKNFKCEIIVQGDFNWELTNQLEIHYIQLYNSTNKKLGYNIEKGGKCRSYCPKKKKSTKKFMSKFMLNWHKELTSEQKLGRSNNIKEAFTLERREKYSEIMKERNKTLKLSEDSKLKIKLANQKYIVKVYKEEKLVGTYNLLECERTLHISSNTIKKIKNTGIIHKGYSFIVEEIAKTKA